ncbi:hypothetical protein PENSPDRAFT_754329 [Peniophora sp. CONT]|nr:hypothetical protein PENSPDRAFT_754329 [Peniophora sp. CONT]
MLRSILALCFLATLVFQSHVSAQDYSVPPWWQNTSSSDSRADRLSTAWKAASEIQSKIVASRGIPTDHTIYYSTVSSMVIALAFLDYRSRNDSWQSQIIDDTLPLYEAGKLEQDSLDDENFNRDIADYGLAEVAAGLAYNDSGRLNIAKGIFDTVYNDFVPAAAAADEKYPRAFNTTCGSSELGGLVFDSQTNATDLSIYSNGIASWIALGARLSELLNNSTFLTAAEQSIQFMHTHMIDVNSTSAIVSDRFDVTSCSPLPQASIPTTYDIGPYIEGLSIVANVTKNPTYIDMLDDIVTTVVRFPGWHNNNGVLIEDLSWPSKGTLIRGLLEARLRNPSNSAMVALIDSYITVQYNTLRQNALTGNNSYKSSWLGNGAAEYSTTGSVDALDLLNAAFVIAPTNTSSVTPTSTTSAISSTNSVHRTQKHASANIGTIVGAAVGGTVAVATLFLGLCFYQRRRRRAREMPISDDSKSDITNARRKAPALRAGLIPEPFTMTTPAHDRSTSPTEKGRSQQRMALLHEYRDNGTPSSPSIPLIAAIGDSADAQNRPAVGDSNALHILERRLDSLIHTLAIQGENGASDPPEYDGNGADHVSRRGDPNALGDTHADPTMQNP